MAFRSQIETLVAIRARGQRPDGYVVIGDGAAAAWAARNGYFFVPEGELGEDLTAFTGLFVLVRTRTPHNLPDAIQRLAFVAKMLTVYDVRSQRSRFFVGGEVAA